MSGISYSGMGILAIVIHCIINRDMLFSKEKNKYNVLGINCYRRFLWGVLAYYFTDTMWGILNEFELFEILKVDTFLYYIAMSIAVVLWCDYVVAYLHRDNFFGVILKYFGRLFVGFEIGALLINIYKPIFFWFDDNGDYHAGKIRYLALYIQIGMFLVSTIQTLIVAIRKNNERRRYLAIGLFGMSMTAAIVLQVFFPLFPIYSVGYLVGTCFLHVFVEEDEKSEYISIVSTMSNLHFCSYYIDMRKKTFVELDNKIPENESIIGKSGVAAVAFEKMCKHLVPPEYQKEMHEFTNLDTLDERLPNTDYYISIQFKSLHLGWAEGYFIASDRDENGKLCHAIWAIRTINDEKQKEEKLFYNSYIDELTGLYNRKMYSEDTEENIDEFMKDDFLYVSMDLNGLKHINDTKGHVAGDELIKGAAVCMKKVFEPYGRVYRTGGDEFIAILNIASEKVNGLMNEFKHTTANYKGKYIDSISVSTGYVIWNDNKELSISQIERLADERMYLEKRNHYTVNANDRRMQQSAYTALCAIYNKILMINLSENKYSIISMNEDEQSDAKGFSEGIFEWLEGFAKTNQVHEADREYYLSMTSREYLTNYFKENKKSLKISYRRKVNGIFKMVEMEMLPSENYSNDNQNIYLYVKTIEE